MIHSSKSVIQARSGQTMILTVLVLSGTLLSIALIAGIVMLYQIRQAGDFTNSAEAVFAADAGINWWFSLKTESTSTINNAFTNQARFEITALPNGDAKVIGISGNSKRAFLVHGFLLSICQPDLMLIVDRSDSIATFDTEYENALRSFVNAFSSLTRDFGQIGFVSFGSPATFDRHLTDSSSSIRSEINSLSYGDDGIRRNLESAIQFARRELGDDPALTGHFGAPPYHDRDDAVNNDLALIVTDGLPNRPFGDPLGDAEDAADLARASGTRVFVVGINPSGNAAFDSYFETRITDQVSDYYSTSDYDAGLQAALFNALNEGVCPPN